jgi:hypothetical protein
MKLNKIKLDFFIAFAIFSIATVFALLYKLMVYILNQHGYKFKTDLFMAFQPHFMIPVFLTSSLLYNLSEFKFYSHFLSKKKEKAHFYPILFFYRFLAIELLLLIGFEYFTQKVFIFFLIFSFKISLQYWENRYVHRTHT